MAPSRRPDLAKVVLRALIAGTLTCFLTACVAGVLTEVTSDEACLMINVTTAPTLDFSQAQNTVSLSSTQI